MRRAKAHLSLFLTGLILSLQILPIAGNPDDHEIVWSHQNDGPLRGVTLDATGIYVVGHYDSNWLIEKRDHTSGSTIWSVTCNPGWTSAPNSIAADDTGIYIVGFTKADNEDRQLWIIEKRGLDDGNLKWSRIANPEEGNFLASDIALDSSGVYIVGSDDLPGDREWRIEKRGLIDGELKWSQISNPTSDYDYATEIAVDNTGVYIIGVKGTIDDASWRIEKRELSDGALIWHKEINPSSGDDAPYGIAVDSTAMYIVGFDNLPGGGDYAWRFEKRDLSDGSLIWSDTNNPSPISDSAQAVAVDRFGLFIVGYDGNITRNRWRVEKRNPSNGKLIWEHTIERQGEYHADIAADVALDETSAIIVGHVLLETQVGRIEKITKGTIIQSEPDPEQGPKGIPGFPLPAILLGLIIALLMRSQALHKSQINHPYFKGHARADGR